MNHLGIIILYFSFMCCSSHAQLPDQYEKKTYTKEEARKLGRKYYFTYGFRDHLGAYRELKWSNDVIETESFMYRFGLNEKHSQTFNVGKTELLYSMMIKEGRSLSFDYSKIVEESRPLIKPLWLQFKSLTGQYNLSARERVELIMRFLQDVPYGIPPENYKGRYIAGLFPPMELLINTWGDCDSKSILMATLLSFDQELYDKIAMILVPGHALLGLRLIPGPYERYIDYRGSRYIYAEPVGLARSPLGKTNSPYSNAIDVRPLVLTAPPPTLEQRSGGTSIPVPSEKKGSFATTCPDNGLSIEYDHPFSGEKIKSCQLKVNGKYVKHGPTRYFSPKGDLLRDEMFDRGEKI